MERKGKIRFFPYGATDYKAAEVWLNEQAAEGWALKEFVYPYCFVRMVPTERPDLTYCVELTNRKEANNRDYLDFCQEAGWEEVANRINIYRVFQSREGTRPTPLQTEPCIELERLVHKRLKRDVWATVLSPFILFLLIGLPAFLLSRDWPGYWHACQLGFLSSPFMLFFCILLLISPIDLIFTIRIELDYWRKARDAVDQGLPFPVTDQKTARRRGWIAVILGFTFTFYVLFVNLFNVAQLLAPESYPVDQIASRSAAVLLPQDIAVYDTDNEFYDNYCNFERRGSPLMKYTHVMIPGWPALLSTERYDCVTENLSSWAAKQILLRESEDFRPAELGFDESWLADTNYGAHYLLLRQGKTVVLLSSGLDWTDPDILGVLWERLQLKE